VYTFRRPENGAAALEQLHQHPKNQHMAAAMTHYSFSAASAAGAPQYADY